MSSDSCRPFGSDDLARASHEKRYTAFKFESKLVSSTEIGSLSFEKTTSSFSNWFMLKINQNLDETYN